MQILLTRTVAERYGALVREAAPQASWLVMDDEGVLHADDDTTTTWEGAHPDVAFVNAEIYDEPQLVRKFFGFLVRCETLEWVQSSAAGFDHPVFEEITRAGAILTNAHVGDINISEYVIGQVLSHHLGLDRWRQAQHRKEWAPHIFRELRGDTWMVVGMGTIGSAVATRARAFGCSIIGVRRSPTGTEPVDEMIGPEAVRSNLGEADVVVLCAPANDETQGMVDAEFLAAMKPTALLVNIARGSLVDEEALIDSLDAGRPEVAILDVTDTEPLPEDSPLWDHPRVIVTPHSAGRGDGHYRRGVEVFCDNLRRWAAGESLRNVVDPARGGS